MATTTAENLLELILRLLDDPAALDEFEQDPAAALAACGAADVGPADVRDVLVLADDGNDRDHHGGTHLPPPPPPRPQPGESDREATARYIKEYVTNNYVDDRDTFVDNSVNQQIDTDGGDVDQIIRTTSTTASGDGAVAAAGDIDGSTITTGDGNQIGDGNIKGDGNSQGTGNDVVRGDENTTAFGTGAADSAEFDDVSVSGGSALSVGGTATGDQANSDSHDVTERTDVTKVDVDDSFNTESDTTLGSGNTTDSSISTDSHDQAQADTLSHNTVELDPA